jgi:uroporphyrinogen-III synthase
VSASKPLVGQTVVVTRAPEQSGELSHLLREAGAQVVEMPLFVLVPVTGQEQQEADAVILGAARGHYEAVLFTSRNAVAFFHERLLTLGLSPDAVAELSSFAIGPATARALIERGYEPPTVATEAVAEGLLATLRQTLGDELSGRRFLWPRAREARDVLVEGLRRQGARVDVAVLYQTQPLASEPGLPQDRRIDWVTFASPSAVRAFHERFGRIEARFACIGPVTAAAAAELGLEVSAVGEQHTVPGLVAAIVRAAS